MSSCGAHVWRVASERSNGCIQAAVRLQLCHKVREVGELGVIKEPEQVEQVLLRRLKRRRGQEYKPVGQIAQDLPRLVRKPSRCAQVMRLVDDHKIVGRLVLLQNREHVGAANGLEADDPPQGLIPICLLVELDVTQNVAALEDLELLVETR